MATLASVLGARLKRLWGATVSSSSWTESVVGAHAVQATSARQPTAITTTAGNNALSFSSDGLFTTNADVMVSAASGSSSTPNYTLACGICKIDPAFGNDGNGCVLFQIGTGGAGGTIYIYPALSNALRAAGYSSTAFAYGAAPINDGVWHTWVAQWNVSAFTVELWIDGAATGSDPPPLASNNIDLSTMACLFGATDASGTAVYQGGLGSVAVAQDTSSFASDVPALHQALLDYAHIVQFGSAGAVAAGTTSLSVAYPAGIVAGDMLVLSVVNKYPTNGPSTPSGWTLPTNGQGSGGVGVAGADSGTVYTTVFHKIADGTESGSLSVTLTSANGSMGRMFRYAMPSGYSWSTPVAANGAKNTAGTAFSVTTGTAPGFQAADLAFVAAGTNTDARTYSAEALTASGVTVWEGVLERQDSVTANGDDMAMVVSEHAVITGTSSSAPVFAMTASGTATNQNAGSAVVLRLRATASGGALTGSISIAITPAGTLTGQGALTGSVPVAINPVGTLTGQGALVGATTLGITFAGTPSLFGALAGSIPIGFTFTGTATGAGALTGVLPVAVNPVGTLTGAGALTGTTTLAINPSGTLTGKGALTGSTTLAINPSGTLTGAGALSGSVTVAITPAGLLTGTGALSGAVPIAISPVGTLTGAGALAGSVPISITPAGFLSSLGSGAMTGNVPIGVTFTGALTGSGTLVGAVPIGVTTSGTLTGTGALTGNVPVDVSFAGTLGGSAPSGALTGSVTIALTPFGTLTGLGALAGSTAFGISFSGALTDGSAAPHIFTRYSHASTVRGHASVSSTVENEHRVDNSTVSRAHFETSVATRLAS